MAKLKVKRTKLPFKILNEMDQEASAEVRRLLTRSMAIVETELKNAPSDPDEFVLTGVNAPLAKSVAVENEKNRDEQAVRDFNRRVLHRGPRTTRQLGEEEILELIALLPWDGGHIRPDPAQLRKVQNGLPTKEETVPTHLIKVGSFDSAELKEALEGKGTVELLKQKGGRDYWVTKGSAFVFAAKAVRLPAIIAAVREAEDVEPEAGSLEKPQDITEIETLARSYTKGRTYALPSELEPLAEQARTHDAQTLRILHEGAKSQEEVEARERADRKDADRMRVWDELYTANRLKGMSETEANRATREDPKWERVELLAETSLELAARVEARWQDWRDTYAKALRLAVLYAEQDGKELRLPTLEALYELAHQGKPQQGASLMGTPAGHYLIGEEVEIRDSRGTWTPAEVVRSNGEIRVRREDGQYRAVTDPSAIRRKGEGKLTLDNDDGLVYNSDMKEIRVDQFNVIIPAGSNSLKIERALEPITEEMNRTELVVNAETWARNLQAQQLELDRLTEECHRIAGKKFRPNASADCSKILFEERGLPVQRVTPKGTPAMDKDTLQALQAIDNDGLCEAIINAREAQSKMSQLNSWETYAKAGTVQATWNQQGTPMARYSCDSPNLQNRITAIRETIEAPSGYKLISLDLGQAEYVTWASLSGDPTLSQSFIDGTDFHRRMYDEVRVAAPDINLHEEDPRQAGKTINFALLYLMQPFALAKKLGIDPAEAQKLIDAYYARAPLARKYMEDVLAQARRTGQISTKFGRTRYMPELKRATGRALHEANKTAWHHHNAGTAAEVLKLKQVKVHRNLRAAGLDYDAVRIALNMHDELILIARDDVVEQTKEIAVAKFKEPIPGFLPFKVDVRVGQNWLQISK